LICLQREFRQSYIFHVCKDLKTRRLGSSSLGKESKICRETARGVVFS
jgi:hypothetical protein